jgi:pimeloyl-ACP methyl ester carboxylesterase
MQRPVQRFAVLRSPLKKTQAQVEPQLAVIEDAGHAPFIEFPEEFNTLVRNYCSPE